LKLTTDRHEALRGLFAAAELLVFSAGMKSDVAVADVVIGRLFMSTENWRVYTTTMIISSTEAGSCDQCLYAGLRTAEVIG